MNCSVGLFVQVRKRTRQKDLSVLPKARTTAPRRAKQYAAMVPQRLYDLAKVYFKFAGETVDVGASTGRGCQWD